MIRGGPLEITGGGVKIFQWVNFFLVQIVCMNFFFQRESSARFFFDSTSFNVKEMQNFAQFNYSTAEGDSLFGVLIFAKFEYRDYREGNELLEKGIAPHASRDVLSLVKETRLRRVGRYYSLQLNAKAKSVRSSKAI